MTACLVAALLLGGCTTVEKMAYRPTLAAARETTPTPAGKLPVSLTKVVAKKAAPIPRPVYRRRSAAKASAPTFERRPRPPFNQPPIFIGTKDGVPIIFDPDGPP